MGIAASTQAMAGWFSSRELGEINTDSQIVLSVAEQCHAILRTTSLSRFSFQSAIYIVSICMQCTQRLFMAPFLGTLIGF